MQSFGNWFAYIVQSAFTLAVGVATCCLLGGLLWLVVDAALFGHPQEEAIMIWAVWLWIFWVPAGLALAAPQLPAKPETL